MKVPCRKNLYYHQRLDGSWWGLLGESNSSSEVKVSLAFQKGKDYEIIISKLSLSDGVDFVHVGAVGEDGKTHTLFSSGRLDIPNFFNFDEMKESEKGSRRLNIVLDAESFAKLEKIKRTHNDPSYTQAIKRAIATQ